MYASEKLRKGNTMSENKQKLSPCGFGFALGLWWGIGMLIVAWFGWWWGYGAAFIATFSSVYIGYAATFWGGVLGLIWGFVDFFIFGALIAWIYNCCSCCCKKSS